MNFISRHKSGTYLIAGFLVGCWIGHKVLPTMVFFQPASSIPAEETAAARDTREELEHRLAATLVEAGNIVSAKVLLTPSAASVTLELGGHSMEPEHVSTIARQIAASVEGLHAGKVSIFDTQGTHLNLRALQEHEQSQWWTKIAINVAKVLGILAALITLRFILQAAGRGEFLGCRGSQSRE